MKRRRDHHADRDRFRNALVSTWEKSYAISVGDCITCRAMFNAALDLAEWTMVDFMLARPLPLENLGNSGE